MIEFLTKYKEKMQKDEAKIALAQKIHDEKMGIMERFLDVLLKEANWNFESSRNLCSLAILSGTFFVLSTLSVMFIKNQHPC